MIKLALIGKNIQHSRSPEIYQQLLNGQVAYDLLDFGEAHLIPKAIDLFLKYDGISITSPYKKHFLNEIELTAKAKELGAINCLKKEKGKIIGENTDYMAILEILKKWKDEYAQFNVIILGDGVMSKVTEVALAALNIEYRILSRRIVDQLDQINLEEQFKILFENPQQEIVINTCAREFVFKGNISRNAIFWDYNYNFTSHSSTLAFKVKNYFDGHEMLLRQARHALAFWSIDNH